MVINDYDTIKRYAEHLTNALNPENITTESAIDAAEKYTLCNYGGKINWLHEGMLKIESIHIDDDDCNELNLAQFILKFA